MNNMDKISRCIKTRIEQIKRNNNAHTVIEELEFVGKLIDEIQEGLKYIHEIRFVDSNTTMGDELIRLFEMEKLIKKYFETENKLDNEITLENITTKRMLIVLLRKGGHDE